MSERDLATEIDALAKRIAAIERAAEPPRLDDAFPIPAPPASSQPPFAVGQVVECVDGSGPAFLEVGFKSEGDGRPEWNATRFRPIPATVEQEPTEGMKAAAKEICKLHTDQCGSSEFSYGRSAAIISQHFGPELSAKDAEIARLQREVKQLREGQLIDELYAEIERLKGVISSNQPNGKWLDQYGGCRVCGGEIPHGHSAECDYWKLEQQIADSKKFADDVAAAVNGWEYGTRNAYMRDLLIGQIADLRQQLADLTAKLAEAEKERDGWHCVVTDCEKIIGADGTAESPLLSNLPNLVRDVLDYVEPIYGHWGNGLVQRMKDVLAARDAAEGSG